MLRESEVNRLLKKLTRDLIEFPQPTICKHYVAAKVLSTMNDLGLEVSGELALAVVNADDEKALTLL